MNRNSRPRKFIVFTKRSLKPQLQNGMQGFLCSYQMYENDCVQDVHNIFAEFNYFEHLSTNRKPEDDDENNDLKSAVESLKLKEKNTFEIIQIGIKNMLFVALKNETGIDAKMAVHEIIDRIVTKKEKISKNILKMIPIEKIVRADLEVICENFRTHFLPKYFATNTNGSSLTTFAIVCNLRFNGSIEKDQLIDSLADLILKQEQSSASFKVNLTEPDLCVIVDVVKNHCLLSVLTDYYKFKKFNLNELIIANCFDSLAE